MLLFMHIALGYKRFCYQRKLTSFVISTFRVLYEKTIVLLLVFLHFVHCCLQLIMVDLLTLLVLPSQS